jgi:hypothetical protein
MIECGISINKAIFDRFVGVNKMIHEHFNSFITYINIYE